MQNLFGTGMPRFWRSCDQTPISTAKNGVTFSPAGLLTTFHYGVAEQLAEYQLLDDDTVLAGSSGGAITAVTTALRIPPRDALLLFHYVAKQCRDKGPKGTLRIALDEALEDILPKEAHELLNSRLSPCYVAYGEVNPFLKPRLVSQFTSRADLIEVVRASCNVPFYFNGNTMSVDVRGSFGIDGLFTTHPTRLGCPRTGATEREFLISPFPAKYVGLNPNYSRRNCDTCAYEIISPDLLSEEDWPFSLRELMTMSLGVPKSKINSKEPISDEELADTYEKLYDAGAQAVRYWHRDNMLAAAHTGGLYAGSMEVMHATHCIAGAAASTAAAVADMV